MRLPSPTQVFGVLVVSQALLGAGAGTAAATPDAQHQRTTGLIVEREPGLTAAERTALREDAGVVYVRSLPLPRTELVRAVEGGVEAAIAELRDEPGVARVERDVSVSALSTADPLFRDQWPLQNTGANKGTPGADIDIASAWGVSRGEGQVVAVIDSGVTSAQPDLVGRLDLANAYDYVEKDNVPQDRTGHGTHVTGVIAATAGNAIGIAGVAPLATVLPLRVVGSTGQGRLSDVLLAFDHAGRLGVRIVNASFGTTTSSPALTDVIARYPETLFVTAAGNSSVDVDAKPMYPCAVPLPNVVCVGATDNNDLRAAFSNVGAASVDLFAPGARVLSTGRTSGSYALADGTSTAAPHVTGVLALVLAAQPALTAAQAKARLLAGVDPVPGLFGHSVSGGRVNAARALAAPSQLADRDADGTPDADDSCPDIPNPDRLDRDGDGLGDVCDAAPVPAPTPAAGLPAQPPAPVLSAVRQAGRSVRGCRSASRRCRTRQVSVSFSLSAAATLRVVYERKRCVAKRCAYVTVARRDVVALAGRTTMLIGPTVGGRRLSRGRHRAVLRLGAQRAAVSFTVR